jgi:hypothetical protein
MFKPLPADPVLIQKLRVRNRIASLASFGVLVLWPIVNSFIPVTSMDSQVIADYSALIIVIGAGLSVLLIPASVFFFAHALRYKKLLGHLATNPAVFAATEPAPVSYTHIRAHETN